MKLKKILFPVEFSTLCANVGQQCLLDGRSSSTPNYWYYMYQASRYVASKSALPALKQDLLRISANKMNRYSSGSKLKKTGQAK